MKIALSHDHAYFFGEVPHFPSFKFIALSCNYIQVAYPLFHLFLWLIFLHFTWISNITWLKLAFGSWLSNCFKFCIFHWLMLTCQLTFTVEWSISLFEFANQIMISKLLANNQLKSFKKFLHLNICSSVINIAKISK